MEVYAEPAKLGTLGQSTQGRFIGGQDDEALQGWFNGFTRIKSGNYIGDFYLAKKSSVMPPRDIVIASRISIFKSDRTTKPGCPWTWSIQITDGPRRMVMEKPSYSNLYFAYPHEAAVSVRDDLRGGGYNPTQPPRSAIIEALAKEQVIAERVIAAEERKFTVKQRPVRTVDT